MFNLVWHGANWTFILWGALHGIAQILTRSFQKIWDKCPRFFQWISTFAFLNFTWIIFRSDNIRQAFSIIKRIVMMDSLTISKNLINSFALPEFLTIQSYITPLAYIKINYMIIYLLGALFLCIYPKNLHTRSFEPTAKKAIYSALLLFWSIVSFSGVSVFIYFNF